MFFDADLIGLSREHVSLLLRPILEEKAIMSVCVRGRYIGLPKLIIKIDPLLAIGGERAMKRFVFEKLSPEFVKGFAIEIGLNHYCKVNKLPISYTTLKGLSMVIKEKKWGVWKGLLGRVKMIKQILKARFISIRKVKYV